LTRRIKQFWRNHRGAVRTRPFAFLYALASAVILSFATFGQSAALPEVRALKLYNIHTNEQDTIVFKHGGIYDRAGLEKLNRFLRDWRRELPTRMDPHLFDLIWDVYRQSGSTDYIHVVCGYRSPETNGMLRRRSKAVAKNSLHMQGKAMDFFLPDVSLAKLREIGLRMQAGGVGFYPTSGSPFVHMDTGSVRHWPRMSREQLVRVFPNGNTLHIPSDGQPLPGYEQALANYRARQAGATSVAGLYSGPATVVPAAARASAPIQLASADSVDEDAADAAAPADASARVRAAPAVAAAAPSPVVPAPAKPVAVAVASYSTAPPPMPRLAPLRLAPAAPPVVAAAVPTAPRLAPGANAIIAAALAPLDADTPAQPIRRVAARSLVAPDFDFDSSRNWSAPAVPSELALAMAARDMSKPASLPIAPTRIVATIDVSRPLRAEAITTAVLRKGDEPTPSVPTVLAFAPTNEPLPAGKPRLTRASAFGVPIPARNPLRPSSTAQTAAPASPTGAGVHRRFAAPSLTLTALDTQGLRLWIAGQSTRQARYALLTMPDFAGDPSLLEKPDVTFAAGFSDTAYAGLRTDRFAGAVVQTPAMIDLTLTPTVALR
jgi:uncharacterized protein YcbK (DUF882 family)